LVSWFWSLLSTKGNGWWRYPGTCYPRNIGSLFIIRLLKVSQKKIEELSGQRIPQMFDLIAGTSTGIGVIFSLKNILRWRFGMFGWNKRIPFG
jgi:hypothetical protein